jgi:hypothetical protein
VLSFIVLIPAYISLRRLDSNLTPIELKNGQ